MKRILLILPNLDQGGTEGVVMNYFRVACGHGQFRTFAQQAEGRLVAGCGFPAEKESAGFSVGTNFVPTENPRLVFDFAVHGQPGYFEPEARELGALIHRVPTRKQSFFGNIRSMRGIYKKHKYDFIVVCTEHSFAFIELCVAWMSGVKTRAAWSHFTDYQGASKLRRAAHFLARPLVRVFANLYLACAKDAGRWLFGNSGIKSKKFRVVNNAIDTKKFRYNPEVRKNLRDKLGFGGKFVIGMVGRLTHVKNHNFALDVFKHFRALYEPSLLLIAGDGELKPEIEQKAARLGLADYVQFTGAVDNIADYYQAMDFLILPSFHEGIPLVVIEAQAAGLMVLMSNTVSGEANISELAHYKNLQDGAAAWADKIFSLKDYERKAMDLSDSGFHITVEAAKLQEIFLG